MHYQKAENERSFLGYVTGTVSIQLHCTGSCAFINSHSDASKWSSPSDPIRWLSLIFGGFSGGQRAISCFKPYPDYFEFSFIMKYARSLRSAGAVLRSVRLSRQRETRRSPDDLKNSALQFSRWITYTSNTLRDRDMLSLFAQSFFFQSKAIKYATSIIKPQQKHVSANFWGAFVHQRPR